MRVDHNVQMAKAKTQSAATWSGSELVCAAVQRGKNTELCGDDHAPVTRGRMRAQYPLPHGPGSRGTGGAFVTVDSSDSSGSEEGGGGSPGAALGDRGPPSPSAPVSEPLVK